MGTTRRQKTALAAAFSSHMACCGDEATFVQPVSAIPPLPPPPPLRPALLASREFSENSASEAKGHELSLAGAVQEQLSDATGGQQVWAAKARQQDSANLES